MHMADALLSPGVGATFWAASGAALAISGRRLREQSRERLVPLMGVLGAFVFAAQMINFAIPGTGSSGHIGGGLLLAILLGPAPAFLVIASVLTVQALFFADGGLLALGCNIWNLGFYPALAAVLIYRPLAGPTSGRGRRTAATVVAAVAALQLGAFSVVLQTWISGRSDLSLAGFALLMQPIHLAIGLVEGIATAAVVRALCTLEPGIDRFALERRPPGGRLLLMLGVVAAVLAGGAGYVASRLPDGLEWSLERAHVPEPGAAGAPLMPGLVGGAVVAALILAIGGALRLLARRETQRPPSGRR